MVEPKRADVTRRGFLHVFVAAAGAIALDACGEDASSSAAPDGDRRDGAADSDLGDARSPSDAEAHDSGAIDAANRGPVWAAVPMIAFTVGVPATISIAAFVTDPDGDPLAIRKNAAALPPGVTYDSATKHFVYDGVGAVYETVGHVLSADDGRP